MWAPTISGPRARVTLAAIVFLIVALVVADGVRQAHLKAIRNPNDFVTLYAGSICMRSDCNPYNVPQLEALLVARRGTAIRQDWTDQLPIYPPSTLLLLLPFSLLSYTAATSLWFVLSLAVFVFGLCWTAFRSPLLHGTSLLARTVFVLLALHFPKMLQCLGFGNPAVMVTGLLLFGLFDEGDSRRTLRFAVVFLACLLKPPMALPVAVLLLLRDSRTSRQAWTTAGVCLLISVGIAFYSFRPPGLEHWRQDLQANIAIGEQHGMSPSLRGSPSNVMLNLATLPGYFTGDTARIQLISILTFGALALIFLIGLRRVRESPAWKGEGYLLAVAAAAPLTLLPVYHRFCDIGVLLLAAPWVLRQFASRPRWQAWAAAVLLLGLYFSWERRIHLDRFSGVAFHLIQFLYYRGDAVLVLLLTAALLSVMVTRPIHRATEV